MTKDKQQDEIINDLRKIAEQIQVLSAQAFAAYAPEVDLVIQSKCKDCNRIEYLLDHLLDFAGDKQVLNLFRKLCRYYLSINPQAVADYVRFYREQYDEDDEMFKSGYFKNNPIKMNEIGKVVSK
jgi:hypothetical protein